MLAIISDIHANIEALSAVLDHIQSQNVTEILCLGDVVGYGADPLPCLEIAATFSINLCGNHEEGVIQKPLDFSKNARIAIQWTKRIVEDSGIWNTFLTVLALTEKRGNMLYAHGSPRLPTSEYLNPVDIHEPAHENRETKLQANFKLVEQYCFVGHTHIPGVFLESNQYVSPQDIKNHYVLPKNEKAIINIGSIGQPRDHNPNACYVTTDGHSVRWHRVPYDVHKTQQKIREAGLPEFLAERLVLGE
ncbi:MAG: metallophosphoesterase family protein [Planctomycetota bacterium]|jgi:diadenosine tetraphosphatase ApaH/serine/threonine PP2A family protein phosphatase